jgi:hypothetical protein
MTCIVIRRGKYFNYTYASVRWNTWGEPTKYNILVCDDWHSGFCQAKRLDKKLVLFLDSGTVFNNIESFVESIKTYPHQGLVGHIIDPLDHSKFYSLHPQCFLMNITEFESEVFVDGEFTSPAVERSKKNIHDNYTPLWVKPVDGPVILSTQQEFGQKILASHLSNNKVVSNWHQKLRDNKIYLYRNEIRDNWIQSQKSYTNLAEEHVWILNNQPVKPMVGNKLISPASGTYWMTGTGADCIDLVDISHRQIQLAQELIKNWDGNDYGSFVYDFIIKNKLRHLQFDINFDSQQKIQLISSKDKFCKYVNEKFQQQLALLSIEADQFVYIWQQVKIKKISFYKKNMIDYLLETNLDSDCALWLSNIFEYKYTWIKSTHDEISACKEKIKLSGCQVQE